MLSSRDDDDDDEDNHLCIKCNATVIGLDNYVKHRKERCAKATLKPSAPKSEVVTNISSLDPSCSLGADVFFQSLELQSSSKRNPLHTVTPPIRIDKATPATLKVTDVIATTSTQSSRRISPVSNTRGEDWIGGHSLRIVSNEDNQTKLINAVANISGVAKKDIPTSSYSLTAFNDYKPDEDSNEDLDESEDDDDEPTGGKWKPPSNYTGGKWQPGGPEPIHHWRSQQLPTPEPENIEDWDLREEHTGGKWKPIIAQEKLVADEDRDEDYDVPPPGHTKGKWVPGATQADKTQIMHPLIQTKGSVQYWCGPCNRRLGSRLIYEKHLMSNLHLRKTLPENDLEYSGHMGPVNFSIGKRSQKPSQYINNTIYTQAHKKKTKSMFNREHTSLHKKRRNRRPYFVQCAGCKSKVRTLVMGKHLISHYHFRKATATGQVYTQLILDNIEAIVHQSPFQCSPCKFYTNWLSNFLQHWFSEDHERTLNSIEGRIWCSFCKFECDTSSGMLQHMSGDVHSEVVSVINRSMPIIIRKKTIFLCADCKMEFRFNIELKYHSKNTGHELSPSASLAYQELHKCQFCCIHFKSSLTLAAHLKRKHRQDVFFCLCCGLTFSTSEEAKKHRRCQDHRIKQKEKMRERGLPGKEMSKKCPYCIPERVLKNVLKLKEHISRDHPNIKRKCPKCGMAFILPQEVTHHIRSKACRFHEQEELVDNTVTKSLWHCSQCLYQTDSQSECFFHEALHSNPLSTETKCKNSDKVKTVLKYECPMCQKYFRKQSLVHHVRQHTMEKPYKCALCASTFTRPSSLMQHTKLKHAEPARQRFSCSVCGTNFLTKQALTRHGAVHGSESGLVCARADCAYTARSGYEMRQHEATHGVARAHACSHPGCGYAAKTLPQLLRHRKIHGERMRKYACTVCPFRSEQASHLRRHARCHAGSKPYICPHCTFNCSSLENLRKHVIKSRRHPGVHLYTCRELACTVAPFSTNYATEFRGHLTRSHSERYSRKSAVDYVAQYCCIKSKLPPAYTTEVSLEEKEHIISPEELNYTDIDKSVKVEHFNVAEDGTLVPTS